MAAEGGGAQVKKARFTALLMALLLLSGCSAQPHDDQPAVSSQVGSAVKTVIQYYDSTDSTQLAEAVVAAFNAQSANTFVQLHLVDNEVYDNTIADTLRNGGDIDCLYIRQPCQVNQFAAEGLLTDLTEDVARSDLDPAAYGQTLDIISIANTIPALPRTKSVWLLFYNKDILDRYNIPEPSNLTWDQYADLARSLTEKQADGSTRYGGYIPPWTLNLGAIAAGEYLYDDELPYTRKYMQLLNRLYNVDHSVPDITQMDGEYNLPNLVFLDQKIATMINGDWVVYLFKNAYPEQSSAFRWGIATLPVFDDVPKKTAVGSCSYLAIPGNSPHRANAFEFISFFAGATAADMLAKFPTCPAYYTDRSAERYQQNAGVPGANYIFDSLVRNEEGAFVRYRELNITFKNCLLEYLRGNTSLDAAFEQFEIQRLPLLSGTGD
jgi:multiple sugar transport system substrate-binding protein